jgi:hypothetical protein
MLVAARAKAAGGFSDARVLVAADLLPRPSGQINLGQDQEDGAVVRLREAVAGFANRCATGTW